MEAGMRKRCCYTFEQAHSATLFDQQAATACFLYSSTALQQ
jgi:hypothetical protein